MVLLDDGGMAAWPFTEPEGYHTVSKQYTSFYRELKKVRPFLATESAKQL